MERGCRGLGLIRAGFGRPLRRGLGRRLCGGRGGACVVVFGSVLLLERWWWDGVLGRLRGGGYGRSSLGSWALSWLSLEARLSVDLGI